MIKLELPPKPTKLTNELQSKLTGEFIADQTKRVWDREWLLNEVINMSFGKCCYSEIRLNEESKYMEVEHFHPKSLYPNEVVRWGNLLPSCKTCNGTKGNHDTVVEPIVNPFKDNPKDYFYLKDGWYKVKPTYSETAKRTIKILALNDWTHFIIKRSRIIEGIEQGLADRRKDFDAHPLDEALGRLKRLLRKGNRKEEYSALVATTILQNNNFQLILEDLLITRSIWDQELEALYAELEFCALLE